MSTETGLRRRLEVGGLARAKERVFGTVFGDARGLFVFLLALAGFMLLWRTSFTINDNYTIANGLVALSEGHLHVVEPTYGGSLNTPGMVEVDGRAYPRNVGHIVVSLPFLWLLQGVDLVADLRIAIAGAFSLVVLFAVTTGSALLGYDRAGNVLGPVVGLAVFVGNVAVATPLSATAVPYLALQASTMVLGALACVVLYRLLAEMHTPAVGVAAGVALGLATPTILWATIPKRHVVTAALLVFSLFFFYRSRTTEESTTWTVLAYLPVGLTAWVNAAEGLMLLSALFLVDLAGRRDRRTIGVVVGTVFVSLIPFFVTNFLMSGNPIRPPRVLPRVGTGGTPSPSGGGSESLPGRYLPSVVMTALFFPIYLVDGLTTVFTEPWRLFRTFVRSGYVPSVVERGTGLAINVAFVESGAVVGAVVAAPVLAYRRARSTLQSGAGAVDAAVVVYAVLMTLFYLPRLPLYAQITVRYVYPLFPLAVYGVARLPWVRRVIDERGQLLAWTYAVGVLIGAQLMLAGMVLMEASVDEAMQGYALLGLAAAALLGAWSLAAAFDRGDDRVGAVLLGIAAAVGTNFMLIIALYYFGSNYALPIVPSL